MFSMGVDENRSPLKAMAMIIPAAVMMPPVFVKPWMMDVRVSFPSAVKYRG
jgi:hypothetical protein